MRELAIALAVAAGFIAWPYAPWILLAIWAAVLVRPLHLWLRARLGQRPRLAAALVTFALVSLVAPAIAVIASLSDEAVELVRRAAASERVQSLIQPMVANEGGRTWSLAQRLAGTAAHVAIGLVIAIAGTYALLVDGGRWYAWLEAHAPIAPAAFRRLAGAVVETGRGLVFGILGAGAAQAVVATILFVALGVAQPFALGLLTLACSIVPAIGTAIVWVPVAIALAASGREVAAIVLAVFGVLVIGTIDNLVRPYLARKGRLQLPVLVVALAMFGGAAALGARGLLLGPLIVRLAKEALVIVRDQARTVVGGSGASTGTAPGEAAGRGPSTSASSACSSVSWSSNDETR